MKTKLEIIEIMQMLLDNQDINDEYYRIWYSWAIKDLASLLWKDTQDYWIIL